MTRELMHVDEASEFADKFPSEHMYSITVGEIPFAFLYTTTSFATLIWQSDFDFFSVGELALSQLPGLVAADCSGGDDLSTATYSAQVILIFSGDASVKEFEFDSRGRNHVYDEIMQFPADISFARYDVSVGPEPTVAYSFTAENATTTSGEMTLLLPKGASWSEAILSWAMQYHLARNQFKQLRVTPHDVSGVMKNLVS